MTDPLQQNRRFPTDTSHSAKSINCLSLLILVLIVAMMLSCGVVFTHHFQRGNHTRNTELAQFQVSAYLMANGTKLRVNVDKQLGGKATIHFMNSAGAEYYQFTLFPQDTIVRFSLNLAELDDGDYVLKVSNGLHMELRQVQIATSKPTIPVRQITIL